MYTNEPGKDTNKTPTNSTNRTITKRLAVKRIIILGIILAVGLTLSTVFLKPMLPKQYLIFLQVAQVSVIGYFVIEIIGNTIYKLAGEYIQSTAKSIQSFIKIAGAIIVIAIIISYLSQDPLVAASISTISGLVVGFASTEYNWECDSSVILGNNQTVQDRRQNYSIWKHWRGL